MSPTSWNGFSQGCSLRPLVLSFIPFPYGIRGIISRICHVLGYTLPGGWSWFYSPCFCCLFCPSVQLGWQWFFRLGDWFRIITSYVQLVGICSKEISWSGRYLVLSCPCLVCCWRGHDCGLCLVVSCVCFLPLQNLFCGHCLLFVASAGQGVWTGQMQQCCDFVYAIVLYLYNVYLVNRN
jgi:hypothetical protein